MRMIAGALILLLNTSLNAAQLRWVQASPQANRLRKEVTLEGVLSEINQSSDKGQNWTSSDFTLKEDRALASFQYVYWQQVEGEVPYSGKGIRVWIGDEGLIQMEAFLEEKSAKRNAIASFAKTRNLKPLDQKAAWDLAKNYVKAEDTALIRSVKSQIVIEQDLIQRITIKAAHGAYQIDFAVPSLKFMNKDYTPYPFSDEIFHAPLEVQVFPYLEESAGQLLNTTKSELKYVHKIAPVIDEDPFAPMRNQNWLMSLNDASKASTSTGQAEGYWSWNDFKSEASKIINSVPKIENSFENGLVLEGKFASINIHPLAFQTFEDADISVKFGPHYQVNLQPVPELKTKRAEALGSRYAKPFNSKEDLAHLTPHRHPSHDPITYIEDGFDSIQVYYAINKMFEVLTPMGFTDPELSTRPFHAFLYDPAISMKNNAYYTDDTINFTTYSPNQPNYARDNLTIWHELGHGVMDRLMGDVRLADSGGLSEGMADFVAELVLQGAAPQPRFPGRSDMRIINRTGFHLTNESHDDGEAYGGAMKDLLDLAIQTHGNKGITMVADLVMDAMRLSRGHPSLTANDWFDRMIYADALGKKDLRKKDLLKPLILQALESRNFSQHPAEFSLSWTEKKGSVEITSESPGSRYNKVEVDSDELGKGKSWNLSIQLKNSASYQFKFPVTVKVFFNSGPLQGAIDWVGEDQEPKLLTLNNEQELAHLPLQIEGKCDYYNEKNQSCSDYAYIQIINHGEDHPIGKKRFYLHLSE